ncbi:MAG: alpha/beta hydrolase [Desulfobacterales bacterium]|nr:alpha/beta hydrolase [Desulfobacterales bacterium]
MSPEGSWTVFGKYYMGDNDPCLLLISPLYGELHGLPPILIYVGEDEIFLDDSLQFAEKAKNAGADVTLRVGEEMVHCFPLLAPIFSEAKQAMDEICDFINTHVRY